ncbi:hypothetical protein PITC_024530 [Penicillium italicum]|uniref:Uncharacterized protein n=1 Tax=Penicillium italicum TaxID=40296 RepID=A0A0A2LAF2_PENIT|nr:hypothetical protein PITC_024530 [Penicillium italicum]
MFVQNAVTWPQATNTISPHERVRLTPSMIPDACDFDAKDSSFFNNGASYLLRRKFGK